MPPQRESRNPFGNRRRRQEPVPGGLLWLLLLGFVALGLWYYLTADSRSALLEITEFDALVQNGLVKRVTFVSSNQLEGELQEGALESKKLPPDIKESLRRKIRHNRFTMLVTESDLKTGYVTNELRQYKVPYTQLREEGTWLGTLIVVILPALLLIAFFVFFLFPRLRDPLGGGFLSSYIKSPARRYDKTKQRVTFDDVADMQYAKKELQEIVEFLRNPEKFQRLGAQVPKGVLLVGPPGTGKTLLARAVAGEAGVPFFSISGSEFIQMFVGVGASRVRDLFKTAKENAPSLIFIDEIDAVGRMRGTGVGGGSDEREQTLNQILSEMDGFQPNESVIVIAATNRPDVLDAALLRPGRFDRHITVDRPTWQGRLEILKVHTRNKPLADDVNLEEIARKMIGMTGADLRNLANEAALIATRENKTRIDRWDFERAADRVLMGPKRDEVLSPEDKRRTAYHEAGHTLVAWYQPEADPPQKVSIIPRGRTGGVTMFSPEEERFHHGLDYFKAQLMVMMGGRAADRLVYGQPFAGAEDDLRRATKLARYMITHWGMSDRLGPMSFRIGEEHIFLGKEIQEPRDFSEATAAIIDEEVQKLLREADQRALELLASHRAELDRLVDALVQREELLREEIEAILGKPTPAAPSTDGQPAGDGVLVTPTHPSPT
jgi:cell division protease FtsH